VSDLGCGPGWYTVDLGPGAIALDAARAMLDLVPAHAPDAPRVQADLAALPVARHALGGAWARASYVHVPRPELPMALHELHRALAVGAPAELLLFAGDQDHGEFAHDTFPGRRFSAWPAWLLRDVVVGAGFRIERAEFATPDDPQGHHALRLVRERTLADTVGPAMDLLVVGLNPSVHAADAGVGFARPGNRFWPAALRAGLVTRDRDAVHALRHDRVGMTDLVKRASARADGLTAAEDRAGVERLDHLVAWLRPRAVCIVGLAGWRAAVDRRAVAGVQDRRLGGRPVYLMPNPSGINASSTLDDLAGHLARARELAAGSAT
jgi:TDG/mug DNA glycosylase family protein